jgi:integrase
VFADALGAPILPPTASDRFLGLRKAAAIPVGTPHVLRHAHATILLGEGVPLHVVAVRLGDDPKTALSNYAHLLPHSDSEAAEVAAATLVDNPLTKAAI